MKSQYIDIVDIVDNLRQFESKLFQMTNYTLISYLLDYLLHQSLLILVIYFIPLSFFFFSLRSARPQIFSRIKF